MIPINSDHGPTNLSKTNMSNTSTIEKERNLILQGLKLAYERLLKTKRANNGELVVVRDHKIVRIKP
jgi:hypothetical protein